MTLEVTDDYSLPVPKSKILTFIIINILSLVI